MSIYNIKVLDENNNERLMEEFKGKVLLIVNTATGCGLTPQYEGIETLYKKYHDSGLEVLDFPCNQFGKQAPGSIKEITEFCQLNYGTSFPQFAKIDVNGEDTADIFKYLKSKKGGLFSKNIKWNFTKFLVDRNGNVVKRYSPLVKPEKIEKDIKNLL